MLTSSYSSAGSPGQTPSKATPSGQTPSWSRAKDHFAHWTIPEGTVTITNDGVRPRRLISNTNAMLDIVEHVRRRPPAYLAGEAKDEIELLDVIQAGSNLEGVVNAFDGDMSTYWEPELPSEDVDLASQWWFTVDLGRVVIANRMVVRFVAEGAGDPFLLFDVLTSDGQKPVAAPAGDALEYLPLVQTLKPNRTRREFEVDLVSLGKEARRQAIRHVQVVVRASDLDRGREVPDEAAYEALDPADRGRIEYTRRRDGGGEVAVSAQVYEQLHPNRRGQIRYFRRERPRLAELEVWGEGDEIVVGTLDRGGSFKSSLADINADLLIDGAVGSKVSVKTNRVDTGVPFGSIVVDLGSWYWVSGHRMVTNFRGSEHTVSFGNYHLEFSDGSREPDGSFKWHRAASVEQTEVGRNSPSGRMVSTQMHVNRSDFEPVKARFSTYCTRPRPTLRVMVILSIWRSCSCSERDILLRSGWNRTRSGCRAVRF